MKKSYFSKVVYFLWDLFDKKVVQGIRFAFNTRENEFSDFTLFVFSLFFLLPIFSLIQIPILLETFCSLSKNSLTFNFVTFNFKDLQFFLIYFFLTLISLLSIHVLWLRNLIHSALFLVLFFFLSGCLLITLGADFIGFSLIMVYVGAMAILLLFLVMMLDIKIGDSEMSYTFTPLEIRSKTDDGEEAGYWDLALLYFPVFILGFSELTILISENIVFSFLDPSSKGFDYFCFSYLDKVSLEHSIDYVPTIVVIGQVLYTSFFVHLLLIGFILFVAVVGALSLTVTLNKTAKQQALFKQLSRKRDNAFKPSEPKKRSRLFRHYPVD